MTDTTVTPELLLFLAGKMGLEWRHICTDAGSEGRVAYGVGGYCIFNPHTDPAQFGRLVIWAWQNGVDSIGTDGPEQVEVYDGIDWHSQPHDGTEDGIMAAAVVAIARALGWEGE